MHAHPEKSKSWHEEFVERLSGEEHVVKVTVNMYGIAKPTTWLSNAPMIAKRLSELQRSRQGSSKEARDRKHQRSERPVENNRMAEFDNSWHLM